VRPQLARTVFALLLGVSLVMFLTPGDEVPEHGPNDKVVHALVFVALAVAGRWAQLPWRVLGLGLAAYAAVTEVLQATLPIGRDGDVRDWVADVTGIAVGLLLSWLVVRLAARARPPTPRSRSRH
jgi:VanZ family protein